MNSKNQKGKESKYWQEYEAIGTIDGAVLPF